MTSLTGNELGHQASLAVNVSVRCLGDPSIVDTVARFLDESGVSADRLTLEVTRRA